MNNRRTRKIRGGNNSNIASIMADSTPSKEEVINKTNKALDESLDNVSTISDTNFFYTDIMSTTNNTDPSYKEMGVFHMSSVMGVNAVTNIGSAYSNFFGFEGFEGPVIDKLREKLLNNIQQQLKKKIQYKSMQFTF